MNNKVKLFTEEQVNKAIEFGNIGRPNLSVNDYIELCLTPISLPSNEEIEKYIKSFPYTKHLDDGQYNDGVLVGAELGIEWVIDKIKNQQ